MTIKIVAHNESEGLDTLLRESWFLQTCFFCLSPRGCLLMGGWIHPNNLWFFLRIHSLFSGMTVLSVCIIRTTYTNEVPTVSTKWTIHIVPLLGNFNAILITPSSLEVHYLYRYHSHLSFESTGRPWELEYSSICRARAKPETYISGFCNEWISSLLTDFSVRLNYASFSW